MEKKFLILALLVAISACASQPKRNVVVNIVNKDGTPVAAPATAGNNTPKAVISGSNPELTEAMQNGAIKSGDLYYMPIGKDASGCKYYTSFATGKVTFTAVYYRQSDGSFTNNRAEAVCD